MTDNPKAAWPKTPDGTIDWEIVFEDPTDGLVPLVEQSQSAETLRLTAEVVFQKLFTRKNDADARHQLMTQLEDIISAGGDFEAQKASVIALMRQVKDLRIEKARIYIERLHAGAAIDRRAGLFWKIDTLLKPVVLIPVGSIFVIALAAIVYFALSTTLSDKPTADTQAPSAGDAPEMRAATPGQITVDEALEPKAPEAIPIWLKTVRWPVSPEDTYERPQYYAVIPYVMEWPEKIEFCRRVPKVMDTIYVAFNETIPQDRPARIDELAAAESLLQDMLNDAMPEDFVVKVVVARYGTAQFKVSTLPPFCKSPSPEKTSPQK